MHKPILNLWALCDNTLQLDNQLLTRKQSNTIAMVFVFISYFLKEIAQIFFSKICFNNQDYILLKTKQN